MVTDNHYRWDFIGLSTDTKPTPATSNKVVDGSTYYCSDTSKLYVYCKNNWYERKPLGGGGGTTDFDDLDNRPKYNNVTMSSETNIPEVIDTAFTGTDGTADGTIGLVPAPETSDTDKYLKSDGTWATVSASVSPVQSAGTSTSSVMSQNATTSMVFADPSTRENVRIGTYSPVGTYSVSVGSSSEAGDNGVSVGVSASAVANGVSVGGHSESAISQYGTAVGAYAYTDAKGAIALGSHSSSATVGEMNIGTSDTTEGYNGTNYRLLSGVHDAVNDHDAVTLGQLNGRVKQNAGAPTTSTVGTIGQLLEDTTNGKLYQCTAVDTTDPQNPSYTWSEVGAGGGGVTVVQTTGSSTTDVMSQKAVTDTLFNSNNKTRIQIGDSSSALNSYTISIGSTAFTSDLDQISIGRNAGQLSRGQGLVCIGRNASATGTGSIALGTKSKASVQGEMNIGSVGDTSYGYNNTNYRLLTGLHDPVNDHDATTKGYVDTLTGLSKKLTSADYNYDTNNDGVNDTVALWLLDCGMYWWDYSFASNGGIKFTTTSTSSDNNLLSYSQSVMVTYYGDSDGTFKNITAFRRSLLVTDPNYGWAPYVPYCVNTTTGAMVNFQTDAIPVGRGDLTS